MCFFGKKKHIAVGMKNLIGRLGIPTFSVTFYRSIDLQNFGNNGLLFCNNGLLFCNNGLLFCKNGLLFSNNGLLFSNNSLLFLKEWSIVLYQ